MLSVRFPLLTVTVATIEHTYVEDCPFNVHGQRQGDSSIIIMQQLEKLVCCRLPHDRRYVITRSIELMVFLFVYYMIWSVCTIAFICT